MTVHPIRSELDQSRPQERPRVRRVPVTDPLAAVAAPYDYADAFTVKMPPEPGVTPEMWLHAGLAAAPVGVRRVVALLRSSATAGDERGQPSVFRVVQSAPDIVRLEAELPMLAVSLIGRASGPSERTLTTVLRFRRRSARLLWLLVAPLHRRAARTLITGRGSA